MSGAAPRFLFVGDRRSPLARRHNWTWRTGRVCAGTLHEALVACGVDPLRQVYVNARDDNGQPWPALAHLVGVAVDRGWHIVALGRLASRALRRIGVEHIFLTHPAARGSIRKRERYHAHVAEVLAPTRAAAQHEALT